jgi:hypothetical protein
LDDGGYIMVVLLIGMAVSAVWMSAMLPAWRQQAMRQKEAELIFRGEQYARAIALYWRRNNQTLPSSIDVLVSQRYLRRKYVDPITGKEFLYIGGLGTGLGASTPGQPPAAGGRGPTGPATGFPGISGGRAGISGVRSSSTATSIVVYRGQTSYSQFPFDYTFALQRMGGAGGGAARGLNPMMDELQRGLQNLGRGRSTGAPVQRGTEVAPEPPARGLGGRGIGVPPPRPGP